MTAYSHFIALFTQIDKNDTNLVGIKGTQLGEQVSNDLPIPPGFILTSLAFNHFLKKNNLNLKISHLLSNVNFNDHISVQGVSKNIKKIILESEIPQDLIDAITNAYTNLEKLTNFALIKLYPSVVNKDLENILLDDKKDIFLNIKGESVLLESIKHAFATFYNSETILYKHEHALSQLESNFALVIQIQATSDKSGFLQTIDSLKNDKSLVTINAIKGYIDLLKEDKVVPDYFEVEKHNLEIKTKHVSVQKIILERFGTKFKAIKLVGKEGILQKISDKEIVALTKLGIQVEKHYYFPSEVEWAISGKNIYINSVMPLTATGKLIRESIISKNKDFILKGTGFNSGIACGPIKIINSVIEEDKFNHGDILIVKNINSNLKNLIKKSAAVVSENKITNSKDILLIRELGIPTIVNVKNATTLFKNHDIITVNGTKGEILKGGFIVKEINNSFYESQPKKIVTKLFVNLENSTDSKNVTAENLNGILVFNAKHVLNDIGIHPKQLTEEASEGVLLDKFIKSLESICSNYSGKEIIYCLSDLNSSDLKKLSGGKNFEPDEANPLIGFRGTYRHIKDQTLLNLELKALKRVRNSFKNIHLAVSFVRNIEELTAIKDLIKKAGLEFSNNFKLWIIISLPANVISLESVVKDDVDGIIIDADSLTSLLNGIDTSDNETAATFDFTNEASLWAFERIIKTANKLNINTLIYGNLSLRSVDLLKKIIFWGVTGVAVKADSLNITTTHIIQAEKELFYK